MMLAWKARIPKLPVGIDCTLSILRICVRDREWTRKIDDGHLPVNYETDLCLMYSATIMRLLNHISNIGHTKQTSLFQIAKRINIPEWIVNLRHDTAHGYELPNIGVLRIAVNILLAWLHEEYWAPEAKRLEERLASVAATATVDESTEVEQVQQDIGDLIELWTSVSLHIHAGYNLVSSVPDPRLQETLLDLRSHAMSLSVSKNDGNDDDDDDDDEDDDIELSDRHDYIETAASDDVGKDHRVQNQKYTLKTAKIVLVSEIFRYLNRKSIANRNDAVCTNLLASEAFLPTNKDVLSIFQAQEDREDNDELSNDILPLDMVTFWKDIIFLLYEKDCMESLIVKLIELVNDEQANRERRLLASLWTSTLAYSFLKLDIAHRISRVFEYRLEKNLSSRAFENRVKEETDRAYPRLRRVLWLNLSDTVLSCFTDKKFVSNLLLNVNEFSVKFIVPILELASPKIGDDDKRLLLDLVNIYTTSPSSCCVNKKIFTLKDLRSIENEREGNELEHDDDVAWCGPVADDETTVRNDYWKLAETAGDADGRATHNWSECPIGLLPWQDSMKFINPIETIVEERDTRTSSRQSEITPGIIDRNDLRMQSQINWDNVLRKKKRLNRRQERRNAANVVINKAIKTAAAAAAAAKKRG
ncbi:ribosomal biogenesis protein LAS1L isoform X2 [Ceratina calcarata]|nr:ribosomal biogenesis protein LAS1L isoform X2 [Ceratina calcarata]